MCTHLTNETPQNPPGYSLDGLLSGCHSGLKLGPALRNHQFSHFFHKNNHYSRTKKDCLMCYTSICGKLSMLQSIQYKLSSMDKYKGVIKEIPH